MVSDVVIGQMYVHGIEIPDYTPEVEIKEVDKETDIDIEEKEMGENYD